MALNEGVGDPQPFELLGAPGVGAHRFAGALNALEPPGGRFRALADKPFYGRDKGELCRGVQIHLLDPKTAPWTAIQFYAVEILRALHPDHPVFAEAKPEGLSGFDKTMGGPSTREWLAAGKPVKGLLDAWAADDAAFLKRREKYLLYK